MALLTMLTAATTNPHDEVRAAAVEAVQLAKPQMNADERPDTSHKGVSPLEEHERLPLISVHSYRGGVGKTTVTALLGAAMVLQGHRVCLVDLDLVAPGLSWIFSTQPEKAILDYLLIDPVTGRRQASATELVRELRTPLVPERGGLAGILGRPDPGNARSIQAYLMAEVRTGLPGACLEHLLLGVQEDSAQSRRRFDLFILDTPPSLFGLSSGARDLVKKHAGVEVFVAGPTVQDLAAVPEMILPLTDGADDDQDASATPAFILNAYPYEVTGADGAETIARQILRGRQEGDQSGNEHSRMSAWARPLRRLRTRIIPWSEEIRQITLDPRAADEAIWKGALSEDVRTLATELAGDVTGRASDERDHR